MNDRPTSRRTPASTALALVLAVSAAGAACADEDPSALRAREAEASTPTEVVPEAAALLAPTAFGSTPMRRQTRAELRASCTDVFGVDPGALADILPADVTGSEVVNPFDNDADLQDVSTDLVVRLGTFAKDYAALVVKSPARILATAGCTPSGPADAACFEKIVRSVGRLAFRRPVTDDEVTRFRELLAYAAEERDFGSAVDGFVRIVVQHPEVLYRIEIGRPTATPGVFELDDHAIASRISFLLWGRGPDAPLLDAADAGKLKLPGERRLQAARMLADPRARTHWARFHGQWLGYANVTPPAALAADMERETASLVERVVFDEKRPWLDLFRADETFVSPALAVHYGMPAPAAPSWLPYDGARGGGVLSHGAFLLQGAKFGDTSPTLRGYRILKRVLCRDLGAIPPGIDTDNPPTASSPTACKSERYAMREQAACASCHTQTDDIGFGLENFGPSGQWRATEPNLPACSISGEGAVAGKPFTGPRGLGAALASAQETLSCADKQLLRFAFGRRDTAEDAETLRALDAQLEATKDLQSLLRALVDTPAIGFRVERSTP